MQLERKSEREGETGYIVKQAGSPLKYTKFIHFPSTNIRHHCMPATTASLRDRGNTPQCKETFLTITSISPAFSYVTPQPVLLLKTFMWHPRGITLRYIPFINAMWCKFLGHFKHCPQWRVPTNKNLSKLWPHSTEEKEMGFMHQEHELYTLWLHRWERATKLKQWVTGMWDGSLF